MEVIKGSLDRFEENLAIIYSNDNRRFIIPRDKVEGLRAGSRVILYIEDDKIVRVEFDKVATDEARDRISKKYKRLKGKV